MPVGLLEVEGTIDVSQFWPEGRSDADTTKVIVNVAPDAIRFRKSDTAPFHPTHVFDNAKVKGRTATPPIKNGKLTIRLHRCARAALYAVAALGRREEGAAGCQEAGLSRGHPFLPAIPRRHREQGAA
ncbi:hypothetical protein [Bradyrhizobium sp. B117]|uniref:hypothetical protein n=1 Tax=Bradyrhizobium sp. B117 TaxID=3140246 RepID=UPI00318412D8